MGKTLQTLVVALWAALCTPSLALEIRVTGPAGQPLSDAVVFLDSREARAAVRPGNNTDIGQADKRFVPEVTVVPVGTSVSFPNRDTVRHHVYSFSPAKKFEIKLYVGTPASPVVFDRAGIAVLGCNIHDQMAAWVLVVETPWYAKTGADGRATLQQVPPGSYRLRAWHPSLPVGDPASDQPLKLDAATRSISVKLAGAQP